MVWTLLCGRQKLSSWNKPGNWFVDRSTANGAPKCAG